jgi:cation transport regulator ChaC
VYVFGYGSLLDPALPARVVGPAVLRGHRRVWGVAMDNREAIPGYKRYVDAAGAAPAVCVVFLDVVADPAACVNGAVIEVDDALAPALDRRERNYTRVEVGADVGSGSNAGAEGAGGGVPVWAFVGRDAGRVRAVRAREEGIAVVSRAYLDRVRADFASFGPEMLATFDETTDPVDLPLLDLTRVDVPGGAPRTAVEGVV